MPVQQAAQGTRVEPNHVYIIPPNTEMAIRDGVLDTDTARRPTGRGIFPLIYF